MSVIRRDRHSLLQTAAAAEEMRPPLTAHERIFSGGCRQLKLRFCRTYNEYPIAAAGRMPPPQVCYTMTCLSFGSSSRNNSGGGGGTVRLVDVSSPYASKLAAQLRCVRASRHAAIYIGSADDEGQKIQFAVTIRLDIDAEMVRRGIRAIAEMKTVERRRGFLLSLFGQRYSGFYDYDIYSREWEEQFDPPALPAPHRPPSPVEGDESDGDEIVGYVDVV